MAEVQAKQASSQNRYQNDLAVLHTNNEELRRANEELRRDLQRMGPKIAFTSDPIGHR